MSNAGAARQSARYARGVGYARCYCAELMAVLRAAEEVGYLQNSYNDVIKKVHRLDSLLAGIAGVIESRV